MSKYYIIYDILNFVKLYKQGNKMNKINLSLATIFAVSTFAVAGGDIAPVEPVIETPMMIQEESTGGFYVGAAYSIFNLDIDRLNYGVNNNWELELDYDAFMLQAGYAFNDYVAVEGRYWGALGDGDVTLDDWSVLLKKMHLPIMMLLLGVFMLSQCTL